MSAAPRRPGHLIVLAGPTGAGKSKVLDRLEWTAPVVDATEIERRLNPDHDPRPAFKVKAAAATIARIEELFGDHQAVIWKTPLRKLTLEVIGFLNGLGRSNTSLFFAAVSDWEDAQIRAAHEDHKHGRPISTRSLRPDFEESLANLPTAVELVRYGALYDCSGDDIITIGAIDQDIDKGDWEDIAEGLREHPAEGLAVPRRVFIRPGDQPRWLAMTGVRTEVVTDQDITDILGEDEISPRQRFEEPTTHYGLSMR